MREHLPLVVGGAAGVDLGILDNRLEGIRIPAILHERGYNVIVAIDKHGGCVWPGPQPLTINDGVAGGFHNLGILQPQRLHVGGQPVGGGAHVTDVTNASRTMLMNLKTLDWDKEVAEIMGVPLTMMPKIMPSSAVYGHTKADGPFGGRIPVSGDLGDQQAATVGQAALSPGEAKNTYGTGCFMLMNTGTEIVPSKNGLLTTLCYKFGDKPAVYALEGSIAITGALVQWLRDNLKFFDYSKHIEDCLLYTSPSPRDRTRSRMPSSA